ncbi:hypothetical protein AGMMS50239_29280 [Bacteroidia bacterium]|nr:hypothetical protein AGMMS50239_29280 [Bacteroidia bacterium]
MHKLTFFLLVVIFTFFYLPLPAKEVYDESAQLRSIAAIEDPKDQLRINLSSDTDGSDDLFYLNFADSYSEAFKSIEDAIKLSTVYEKKPAVYSLQEGANHALFVYGIPMKDSRNVRIGFSVPTAGAYTFSLDVPSRTDLRSAELIDHNTKDTINLLRKSYHFSTEQVKENSTRFSILINDQPHVIPMLVEGGMHISGPLRSDGAIHVSAGAGAGKIDIDDGIGSEVAVLKTDTIIFYSNDKFDGLLRNLNTTPDGGVKGLDPDTSPIQVILRKKFEDNKWTYFSLPFKAGKDLKRGGKTVPTTEYDLFEFNPKGRSTGGRPDTAIVWKRVGTLSTNTDYAKANGYQIKFDNGKGGDIDFISNDPDDIDTLFSTSKAKPVKYTTYGTPAGIWDDHNGDNWAFIGGLFSTAYTISQGTTDYRGTIYYREVESSQAAPGTFRFGEAVLSDAIVSKTIGPFTPFYIQGRYSTGDTLDTFNFNAGVAGLLLESVEFRSSNDNLIKDQLYFALSSDKNDSYDRFYLNFADNYVESFQTIEDAVKMSTAYGSRPSVYSLQDGTNRELVVNGLPMKDEREVKMGFSIPEAGDYTISLDARHKQDVWSVILLDKVTGKKIDLLQTPYSFHTSVVEGETGRFTLFINSSYTDIPSIDAVKPYAYAKDNVLTIKNLSEGDNVSVYDLAGRTIVLGKAAGKEFSIGLSQKGVYVVNVKGGETTVLKVLNK